MHGRTNRGWTMLLQSLVRKEPISKRANMNNNVGSPRKYNQLFAN